MSMMPVDFDSEIRNEYPQLAYLLNDPEMGPILRESYQAKKDGHPWPESQFQAEVMKTQWYRNNSASARQMLALQATQPGEYQRQLDSRRNEVDRLAGTLGIGLTPQRRNEIADFSQMNNLSEFEVRRLLIEGDWHLTAGGTEQAVREAYADFYMPLSDAALRDATAKITDGTWSIDGVRAYLAEQSKIFYPHLSAAFDAGQSPRQFFEPYRQQIAQLLELNPNTIDPTTDQKWRPIFDSVDDKGNHRAMTLYETAQYVRSMPEWRKTKQARDQVSQLGETLLQGFGKVA